MGIGRRICVIGAGTMGGGIAAHLANLGFEVTLLDRSYAEAEAGLERCKQNRPPHFYIPSTASKIRLGSIENDLAWIGESDWVCEAIVEKLEAKRDLFELIEPVLRPDAMISTNTSGLELKLLKEGRSDSFRRRLIGTHFFNPPRHLKLLELIPTDETDPKIVEAAIQFLEGQCARRVVVAKDTPGFITNRFGMWSMYFATHVAEKLGLSIEYVDYLTGPLLGRPKSGTFRLNDLVGIDIMQDIASNLTLRCSNDPHTKWLRDPGSIKFLSEKGWIGNKVSQGYYKKEGREFVSLDLRTFAYRERREPDTASTLPIVSLPLPERLNALLEQKDEAGEFVREYLLPTLHYADYLKAEVSHNVRDFDRALKWGFGWEAGPFEMIDMIGAERIGVSGGKFYQSLPDGNQRIRQFDGSYVEPKPELAYRNVTDFLLIHQGEGFTVRDLGDGVTALALTTKMGVFSPVTVTALKDFLSKNPPKRMVLTSEASVFSVGFDLKYLNKSIANGDWNAIDRSIAEFQELGRLIQSIPSVAAVWGYALGGGLEMARCCSVIAAAAETQIGLPESRVGLVPGGGGLVLMRLGAQSTAKELAERAVELTLGHLATNADEARLRGWLRSTDVTVYSADRLLLEAKELALAVKNEPQPEWKPISGPFMGMVHESLKGLAERGEATQHDLQIGDKIAHVFAKASSIDEAYRMERQAFLELIKEGLTHARIQHMVESGKPLRN